VKKCVFNALGNLISNQNFKNLRRGAFPGEMNVWFISELHVTKFKSIRQAHFRFSSSITALVGPNGSGRFGSFGDTAESIDLY
jgi:hypothetical protein